IPVAKASRVSFANSCRSLASAFLPFSASLVQASQAAFLLAIIGSTFQVLSSLLLKARKSNQSKTNFRCVPHRLNVAKSFSTTLLKAVGIPPRAEERLDLMDSRVYSWRI